MRRLKKDYRLRAGDVKALAATHVLAHQHVVDAHEIVARLLKAHPVLLVCAAREIAFLGALQPTHLVIGPLTAMRTTIGRSLNFLYFVKEIAFVHKNPICHRGTETQSKSTIQQQNTRSFLRFSTPIIRIQCATEAQRHRVKESQSETDRGLSAFCRLPSAFCLPLCLCG